MLKILRTASIYSFVAVLAGCAAPTTMRVSVSDSATKAEQIKQLELAAQESVNEQIRLARVYRQIAVKASTLCGSNVGPFTGAYLFTRGKGDMADAMARLYHIDELPTVVFMVEGSGAEKAGLKPKDIVLQINGVDSKDKSAIAAMYETLSGKESITMLVRRSGTEMTVVIQPEIGCRYPASVSPDQAVNAYADGKRIVVTKGMMNFAREDNELALVVSHEMAHNTMKHMEAKKKNAGLGALADIAAVLLSRGKVNNTNFAQAAGSAFSQEFEAEADYVGLYLMANAGLPIADAPKFWRRMAASNPGSIKTNHGASHPSTAYRMLALEETVKEIEAKVAKNEPLMPNMKDGQPVAPTESPQK